MISLDLRKSIFAKVYYRKTNMKSLETKGFIFLLCFTLGSFSVISQNIPKTHVAYKAIDILEIDGKDTEASWQNASWSDSYIDIEGEKKPTYDTKMKMIWDESYLYVFAKMEEPHVWGALKERDTIIFYNNDFEIFIDPDGDTHNYYEFEMNTLNTVWDLFLSKPYRNGAEILGGWDFKGLKSAVSIQGTLNNSNDVDKGWQVEIAIPWSFKTHPGAKTIVPTNEYWRMNFSRVNWDFDLENGKYGRAKDIKTGKYKPEYNWVWSPQGVINMHEPEHWGYVYFSEKKVGETDSFEIPKDEHIKWYLYELFRKQLKSDQILSTDLTPKIILNETISPKLETHSFGWTIWVKSPFTNQILSITKDGKFEVRAE